MFSSMFSNIPSRYIFLPLPRAPLPRMPWCWLAGRVGGCTSSWRRVCCGRLHSCRRPLGCPCYPDTRPPASSPHPHMSHCTTGFTQNDKNFINIHEISVLTHPVYYTLVKWMNEIKKNSSYCHRHTGPVSFRGAEVSCPNILSIACPKIKWFCPNITWFFFFCPKMAIWKILGGGGGGAAATPPPRLVRLWLLLLNE